MWVCLCTYYHAAFTNQQPSQFTSLDAKIARVREMRKLEVSTQWDWIRNVGGSGVGGVCPREWHFKFKGIYS